MKVCLISVEIFAWGKYGGFGRATRIIGRELTRREEAPEEAREAGRRAADLLQPACAAGSASACTILGDALLDLERRDDALRAWREACDRGAAAPCRRAAAAYAEAPDGGVEAAKLQLRACDLGDGAACVDAGRARQGEGDGTGAEAYVRRGCDLADEALLDEIRC